MEQYLVIIFIFSLSLFLIEAEFKTFNYYDAFTILVLFNEFE